MSQMIKDSEEQNDIELFAEFVHVIHRKFAKLDLISERLRGETGLRQVPVVKIDRHHAIGAPPFHFDAVEPAVAADVEYCFAPQIRRNRMLEPLPFDARIIAKEMVRCGLDTANLDVVKP